MTSDAQTMPATDVALIRASFAAAAADPAALAATFYRRLFEAEPGLRAMFPDDLRPQQGKLAAMLAAVVAGLHDWPALAPTVTALGRRHAALGVRAEHYPPVGGARRAALAERAQRPLDTATRAAWGRAFARLAAEMTADHRPGH
jgi:nitric oxide dioxygenase